MWNLNPHIKKLCNTFIYNKLVYRICYLMTVKCFFSRAKLLLMETVRRMAGIKRSLSGCSSQNNGTKLWPSTTSTQASKPTSMQSGDPYPSGHLRLKKKLKRELRGPLRMLSRPTLETPTPWVTHRSLSSDKFWPSSWFAPIVWLSRRC